MAISTRSSQARATIAASRIGQSERDRLQKAVDQIEASIQKYNKEAKSRKKEAGKWATFKKISGGIAKLSAAGVFGPASPVIGAFAAAGTAAAGVQEAKQKKEFLKSAKRIDTSYADPLSDLLFVGEQAKDVSEGAGDIKAEAVAQGQAINDAADIQAVLDIGKSIVLAGQSGTFGEGTQSFLNDPLTGETITLDPDASTLDKLRFAVKGATTDQVSIGSLAGGVTPAQRQMGEAAYGKAKDFFQKPRVPLSQKVLGFSQDLQGVAQDARIKNMDIMNQEYDIPYDAGYTDYIQKPTLPSIQKRTPPVTFGTASWEDAMGDYYKKGGMTDFIKENISAPFRRLQGGDVNVDLPAKPLNFLRRDSIASFQNPFFTDEYLERNRDFISGMINQQRKSQGLRNLGNYSLGTLRSYMGIQ